MVTQRYLWKSLKMVTGKGYAKKLASRVRRLDDKATIAEEIDGMPDFLERWGDGEDAEIAELRLAEINVHPELVLRGEELRQRMREWEVTP